MNLRLMCLIYEREMLKKVERIKIAREVELLTLCHSLTQTKRNVDNPHEKK